MKRGPKPKASRELIASGTFRPVRHGDLDHTMGTTSIIAPDQLPQAPDWLTNDGHAVWLDNIGRVSQSHGATELDSDFFANFCNVQGTIISLWREGQCPRPQLLAESRKMMEMLRLAGPSSRVAKAGPSAGTSPLAMTNTFMTNGRKR